MALSQTYKAFCRELPTVKIFRSEPTHARNFARQGIPRVRLFTGTGVVEIYAAAETKPHAS